MSVFTNCQFIDKRSFLYNRASDIESVAHLQNHIS